MAILRDFEKRLEGAVEGFFARAFRSGLQPVELAKAVQRYAANYQQVGVEGVFVPNVYRFDLSPEDMARFEGFAESLRRELADVVVRTAGERTWGLRGPVRVELRSADHVRVGTYELRGKVEVPAAPAPGEPPPGQPLPGAPPPGAPRPVLQQPSTSPAFAPGPGEASLHVLAGPTPGRRFDIDGSALIGRLPECDVTLDDPSVSRRHARVVREHGRWVVEDLGSTNGVRVNGTQVGRAELHDGDRLDLGAARLAFAARE